MPAIYIEGEIPPSLTGYDNYQAYNILDSAVTSQLFPVMSATLDNETSTTYDREMRLQSYCLDISSKGFPINRMALAELDWELEKNANKALNLLHQACAAVDFRAINPRSIIDVAALFYDHLKIPPIHKYDHKTQKRTLSTDGKALEKIREQYPIGAFFVNCILAYRENAKMRSVFKRGLEPITGNLRCSFSPSGTETGRMSSQQNPYQRGTNAQNLTDKARQVIEAPEGFLIVNADLKTAESIAVGYLSADRGYINACESGDLHTMVTKMNWKHLPWTDDIKQDKKIAEQPAYRHFSYRDLAKKGGHGTNYYGQPATMAQHTKLPKQVLVEFQEGYFAAFPNIPEWHLKTIADIQQFGTLTTPLGRKRRFWGRPNDPATHREAIAFCPQSLVADVMNEGLMQVQRFFLSKLPEGRVGINSNGVFKDFAADSRAQVHDAGVFLIPIDGHQQIIEEIAKHIIFPVDFGPLGVMSIPVDFSIGKTWCKYPKSGKGSPSQLLGLKDYDPTKGLHF